MFIAPGIFYENLNLEEKKDLLGNSLVIDNRKGLKLDIGVDFDYNISVYFTNGVSALDYTAKWTNLQSLIVTDDMIIYEKVTDDTPRTAISGRSFAYFYGLGLAYRMFDRISLILEYSMQSNSLKAKTGSYETTGVIFDRFQTESKFTKLGMAIRF